MRIVQQSGTGGLFSSSAVAWENFTGEECDWGVGPVRMVRETDKLHFPDSLRHFCHFLLSTEMAKKGCPRLCELALLPGTTKQAGLRNKLAELRNL